MCMQCFNWTPVTFLAQENNEDNDRVCQVFIVAWKQSETAVLFMDSSSTVPEKPVD